MADRLHPDIAPTRLELQNAMQKGVIGLSIYSLWPYPMTNSTEDLEATNRCLDFFLEWILEPLISGDYPERMKKIVGSRLPSFTNIQSEAIIGSADFIGINHYYSVFVNDRPLDKGTRDYTADLSIIYKGKHHCFTVHKFL
uniref:Uncharacterized protein n=1 Tax=Aegilops tauschii subsp. strangulata TaxID=200361 RepID=A0A453GFS9_AEGTS